MNMGAILLAPAKWLCLVLPAQKEIEEEDMRNCWRHNKKLMNAGEMKAERVALFNQLLELGEKYRHVNQYG